MIHYGGQIKALPGLKRQRRRGHAAFGRFVLGGQIKALPGLKRQRRRGHAAFGRFAVDAPKCSRRSYRSCSTVLQIFIDGKS